MVSVLQVGDKQTTKTRKIEMKKLVIMIAAVAALVFTGCKTVPTADKINAAAQAVGCASGLVANETKVDAKSRDAIIEIVQIVKDVVPEDGKTFAEAWAPVAKKYTSELVAAGKLNDTQAALVNGGVSIAATGLDYVFNLYPKAKEYKELVSAAVNGFSEGFLTTFKPVNVEDAANCEDCTVRKVDVKYDRDAYIYIKARFKK